ncbi:hypothetical protein G647_02988 [Cladophialophora carrionii CBS 160.54]|uniref:Uncharacterized protein n=1 Tax=Cladophialophora carrionii CBS 160.54 TaxID=1279043 RepID=V9DHN6_9EURO|nr:uncharacterized protein G647_02988 [Cladophialophora carrionii CBS 160.54]ETI26211.1 hypothetical protein G647_02988 [Cladophialophora carrionii CBS 160.54]
MAVFKQWMMQEIFTPDEETVVVVSLSSCWLEPGRPPTLRNGFSNLYLFPILGGPEITIPLGQIPFQPLVSGRVEQLPVGLSLLAAPGEDMMLVVLTRQVLDHSGRPTYVLTGKEMYRAAENREL